MCLHTVVLLFQEQDGGKVQEEDKKQLSEDSVQDAAVCKEEDSDINVFVTKRRGRENASKRKLTDAAAACDANMTSKVFKKTAASHSHIH